MVKTPELPSAVILQRYSYSLAFRSGSGICHVLRWFNLKQDQRL